MIVDGGELQLVSRNGPTAPSYSAPDRRPVSIARVVQRRAAIQNAWRCPVEQKRCADPPVRRRVNGRPHQTHVAALPRSGLTSALGMNPAAQCRRASCGRRRLRAVACGKRCGGVR